MRKCKTEGCGGHLEGKAVYCKPCIQDRRRKRYQEHMAAKRRDMVRKCADCGADRPKGSKRYCRACAFKRHLRSRRGIEERQRKNRPRFVYCPADQPFADWLDKLFFQRPMLPPVLDHEPETWQPFQVPNYLK